MWLLWRKAEVPKANGEILPASTGPMRRIEITVERHSIKRFSPIDGTVPAEVAKPETGLQKPPDE